MTDPTALPNVQPPAPEHPLRAAVLQVLRELELDPSVDGDGDVAFVVNEQQLFARCTEGDVPVLRMFGQWQLPGDSPKDEAALLEVCNEINLNHNCMKSGLANGTLVITSEHIVSAQADVAMLTPLSVQIVLQAVAAWHERAFGPAPTGAVAQEPQS